MKQPLKAVNVTRRALAESCLQGFAADRELTLHMAPEGGAVVTRRFDTGGEGCTYQRLTIGARLLHTHLEAIAAATDALDAGLDAALMSPQVKPAEKARLLLRLPHVRAVNSEDILLHGLEGRYVYLYLSATPLEPDARCALAGLRLEFPKACFTEYFPEIYQGNEFFERYIAIFQSMYLDIEREVDELPQLLDYECAPDDVTRELAGWLGVDDEEGLLSAAQLRHIIRNIDLFQGGKGTRAALERVVELSCGLRPRIVERFEWESPGMPPARRALYGRLYGETPRQFCVILDLTRRRAPLPVSREQLERLIESYSPMGSSCVLVLLERSQHTDSHCYLDINSCLSSPEVASAAGFTLGGHVTVG